MRAHKGDGRGQGREAGGLAGWAAAAELLWSAMHDSAACADALCADALYAVLCCDVLCVDVGQHQGQFAPTDPPVVEEVPADAVDSAGKPVNAGLYKAFWALQASLQDPAAVLKVADNWNNFRKGLSAVLTELARSPATVAAVRTADLAQPGAAAAAGTGAAAAAGAAAAQQQQQRNHQQQQSATQCYLSSYKLFGLQLADSSFRRGFLVQVLVMLRCLLLPGKQPTDTLKPKQRMEAVELEKQVRTLTITGHAMALVWRHRRQLFDLGGTWCSTCHHNTPHGAGPPALLH